MKAPFASGPTMGTPGSAKLFHSPLTETACASVPGGGTKVNVVEQAAVETEASIAPASTLPPVPVALLVLPPPVPPVPPLPVNPVQVVVPPAPLLVVEVDEVGAVPALHAPNAAARKRVATRSWSFFMSASFAARTAPAARARG